MRKLIVVLGVAAVAGVLGASTVDAQRLGGTGGRPGVGVLRGGGQRLRLPLGGPRRAGRAFLAIRGLRQLDLTAAQRAQIRDIVTRSRDEMSPLLKQVRDKRQEMRAAIQGGTAPNEARSTARASLADVQQQLSEIRAKTRTAIRSVLTPEQQEKLKTLRPNRPRN